MPPVSESSAPRLIVFTRYPAPGRTKTRLIPALGPAGAAALARQLAEQTISLARAAAEAQRLSLEVCYSGADEAAMRAWLGDALAFVPQAAGDLGARINAAFERAFAAGSPAVVLVGTDVPELGAEDLGAAFAALQSCPLVLGPARDGGYYLIGLRHPAPALFCEIPWSTSVVLERTLQRAAQRGLRAALLRELDDLDRPADLTP